MDRAMFNETDRAFQESIQTVLDNKKEELAPEFGERLQKANMAYVTRLKVISQSNYSYADRKQIEDEEHSRFQTIKEELAIEEQDRLMEETLGADKLRPPPDCPKYRLKEIFAAQKGQVPTNLCHTFNETSKPYINIKAFERGIIDWHVHSKDGVPVSEEELLIVWDGARSGLVGKNQSGILDSTLKKLTLKPTFSKALLPYFYFFLQQQYPYINRMSRGSVIKHVDPTFFWNLEVPVPDEDSERFERITKVVEAIELIEQHTVQHLKVVRGLREAVLGASFKL